MNRIFIIGKSYLDNLGSCLSSSIVAVPIISKEFTESPYCMKDLNTACHCFDQGVIVMPLLFQLPTNKIPDIVKKLIWLDVSENDAIWMRKFVYSLNKVIPENKLVSEAQREADQLFGNFLQMSAEAKILFSLMLKTDDKADILKLIQSLPTEKIFSIFGILMGSTCRLHEPDDTKITVNRFVNTLNICIVLSFKVKMLSLCDATTLSLISQICATHFGTLIGNNKGHKKVIAVFEYLLNQETDKTEKSPRVFHLCYESNYHADKSSSALIKVNSISVFKNCDIFLRRSCLDVMYS